MDFLAGIQPTFNDTVYCRNNLLRFIHSLKYCGYPDRSVNIQLGAQSKYDTLFNIGLKHNALYPILTLQYRPTT